MKKLPAEQLKHMEDEWKRKYGSEVFTDQAKLIFFEGYKSALNACPCYGYKQLIEHHKEHHTEDTACPECGGKTYPLPEIEDVKRECGECGWIEDTAEPGG